MDISMLTFFEENMYVFLFLIPFIGQLWIPSGSIFFLLFAGSLSSDMRMLCILGIIGTISAILGDATGYFLWKRFFQIRLIQNHLKKEKFRKIYRDTCAYFKKEGKFAIFITRFLVVTPAPYLNYIIWLQKYDFVVFMRFVIFGEILYVGELLLLWYIFKDTFEYLTSIISYLSIILILFYAIYLIAKTLFKSSKTTETSN